MWRWLGESLGEWSCFPFRGMARPANEHPKKGIPSRGCLARRTLVEGISPVKDLEPQMDLELASHKAQVQAQWAGPGYNGDFLIVLSGHGCSFVYVAEMFHHGNAPGQ